MTDLALNLPLSAAANPISSPSQGARWLAVFILLAGVALPDCCLNGSHGFGAGMETWGAICRARG